MNDASLTRGLICTAPKAGTPGSGNVCRTMFGNDAGAGARITDECNYENNTATVKIVACIDPR